MIRMGKSLIHKSHQYQILAKTFLMLLLVYLLFHLFLSERSIPSLIMLSQKEKALEKQLSGLHVQRDNVANRVVRLRPETLDPDLVEEYAIQMLGHRGGEAIIMLDDKQG